MKRAPIRILHVLDRLNAGGIETWLIRALRTLDRDRFAFDFLVQTDQPSTYDDEARSLGARVISVGSHRQLLRYSQRWQRVVREHGPYQVVHSHSARFSGYTLLLARLCGVPMRIAHSHTDERGLPGERRPLRRAYSAAMRASIRCNATLGLAASQLAAGYLFGADWNRDRRFSVLHCGIDLSAFRKPAVDRAELGIPRDAFVVGHVGRFVALKNHRYLLDVFAELRTRRRDARLLLVGDGALRADIAAQARARGLADSVIFAGQRPDVARLLGACDLFVLPSVREGLGLALLEAQAAGLRCLASDAVPAEAQVVPGFVRRLPLDAGAAAWADELLRTAATPPSLSPAAALATVERSSFSITASTRALEGIYARAH